VLISIKESNIERNAADRVAVKKVDLENAVCVKEADHTSGLLSNVTKKKEGKTPPAPVGTKLERLAAAAASNMTRSGGGKGTPRRVFKQKKGMRGVTDPLCAQKLRSEFAEIPQQQPTADIPTPEIFGRLVHIPTYEIKAYQNRRVKSKSCLLCHDYGHFLNKCPLRINAMETYQDRYGFLAKDAVYDPAMDAIQMGQCQGADGKRSKKTPGDTSGKPKGDSNRRNDNSVAGKKKKPPAKKALAGKRIGRSEVEKTFDLEIASIKDRSGGMAA
jgi:hypothetical protein